MKCLLKYRLTRGLNRQWLKQKTILLFHSQFLHTVQVFDVFALSQECKLILPCCLAVFRDFPIHWLDMFTTVFLGPHSSWREWAHWEKEACLFL